MAQKASDAHGDRGRCVYFVTHHLTFSHSCNNARPLHDLELLRRGRKGDREGVGNIGNAHTTVVHKKQKNTEAGFISQGFECNCRRKRNCGKGALCFRDLFAGQHGWRRSLSNYATI